ncbi:MAG: formin [Tardiphaga sp.]|jgi:hypothetical protein|nr:formin [Tardiphaga sp.]
MSVSSVSAAPPVATVKPIEAQAPDIKKNDDDKNDSRVAPPPPRAALPPGQGTRIDQFA